MGLAVDSIGTHIECSRKNPRCTRTDSTSGIPGKRQVFVPFVFQHLVCQSAHQTTLIYSRLVEIGPLVRYNDCVLVRVVAHIPYGSCQHADSHETESHGSVNARTILHYISVSASGSDIEIGICFAVYYKEKLTLQGPLLGNCTCTFSQGGERVG
jgi:hypothetical protein